MSRAHEIRSERRDLARASWLLVAIAIGIAACDTATSFEDGPGACGFPPGTELSFAGEAALSQLGLAQPGLGDEWGMIYVTADRIRVSPERPARLAWCLVPPPGADFGSQVGEIPAGWVLPDPLPPLAQPPERRPPPPTQACTLGQEIRPPPAAEWPGWRVAGAMAAGGHEGLQFAAFDGGVVAISSTSLCPRDGPTWETAYWLSADGRSWEEISMVNAFGDRVSVFTVYTALDGRLVAVGVRLQPDGFDPETTMAWRSSDGETWEPIENWSVPLGWVLRSADRWLLVPWWEEEPQTGEVSVWGSADGYAWTPSGIALPEGAHLPSAKAATASDAAFAIIACPQQQAVGWDECRTMSSEDGAAWAVSDPLTGWWWHIVSHGEEWRAVSWGRPDDTQSLEGHTVRVWRSEDAIEWEALAELPVRPERSDGELRLGAMLVDAGPVLVLTQYHPTDGIPAWSSYDGGVTWEQDGPRLNTVLASLSHEGVTILAGTMNDGPIVFWIREE